MPLVSIIIPTYNHEIYISNLFKSLINQTYKNCELIFCDDCSSDRTYEHVIYFKNQYNNIFKSIVAFRQNINIGLPKNLNSALNYVKGEYIKIIASDDILLDDAIERYVMFMEKNINCSYVLGNAYIVGDKYEYGDSLPTKLAYDKSLQIDNKFFYKLALGDFICAPGVFFRKTTFDKYGNFDERFKIEDYPFWIKSFDESVMLDINPYVCYRYTYKPNSYRKNFFCNYNYYEFIYHNSINKIVNEYYKKRISTVFLSKLFLEFGFNDERVKSISKEIISNYKISMLSILFEMFKHKLRITKKHFIEFYSKI